jgi:hypothetical protein
MHWRTLLEYSLPYQPHADLAEVIFPWNVRILMSTCFHSELVQVNFEGFQRHCVRTLLMKNVVNSLSDTKKKDDQLRV